MIEDYEVSEQEIEERLPKAFSITNGRLTVSITGIYNIYDILIDLAGSNCKEKVCKDYIAQKSAEYTLNAVENEIQKLREQLNERN